MTQRAYSTLARRGFLMPTRLNKVQASASSFEAAGTGSRTASWKAPSTGPVSASLDGLRRMQNRSRAATRNNPYAFAAIDRHVSNTIGTGITPKPMHKNAEIRAILQEGWNDWVDDADADGRTDFYGLQALVCRATYESGECFIRLRVRKPEDGLFVPLQLQVLESEYVPIEKNETLPNGNQIRAGIEFDQIGRRVAYWMYKSHPSDGSLSASVSNTLARVPANQVLHIAETTRPGQLRGVPVLAPILLKLKTLDDFDDAVLFRQEVANLFAGYIQKPAPEDTPMSADGSLMQVDTDGYTPMLSIEPGSVQELLPGEEVHFSDPPDAGNTYPDFMRQQLQASAAGAGMPYEVLTGDMRGVNDRVIRVVLNEFRRRIEQRQWHVYIPQMCKPIRNAWIDLAHLTSAIHLPDYWSQRRLYLRTRWVPQGWAYIHPVQDVQAKKMEIDEGLASRSEVVLRSGYDAEIIDAENAEDMARENRLGLAYGNRATSLITDNSYEDNP